ESRERRHRQIVCKRPWRQYHEGLARWPFCARIVCVALRPWPRRARSALRMHKGAAMGLRIGDEPVPGYKLVRFLGRGGFGQVWAASSPGGVLVAMKIIDLGGREGAREFKALRLMKLIRHAHLTPILAFWFKDEDGNLVDESQVANDLPGATAQTSLAQNL